MLFLSISCIFAFFLFAFPGMFLWDVAQLFNDETKLSFILVCEWAPPKHSHAYCTAPYIACGVAGISVLLGDIIILGVCNAIMTRKNGMMKVAGGSKSFAKTLWPPVESETQASKRYETASSRRSSQLRFCRGPLHLPSPISIGAHIIRSCKQHFSGFLYPAARTK